NRVRGEPMELLSAPEDRVKLLTALVDRSRAQATLGNHTLPPAFHPLRRDLRQWRVGTELLVELANLLAVVLNGRRAALAVLLDVAHPLIGHALQRHVRASWRANVDCVVSPREHLLQTRLRLRPSHVALRRVAP